MRTTTRVAAIAATALLALTGCSSDDGGDTAGEGTDTAAAGVEFAGVEDGATVSSPVSVEFATTGGFEVISAADGGGDGAGHMHVMIDVGCVAVGEEIPADDSHVHFGDGSTSTELELETGEHTLCLQAGDGDHIAMDATDEITITVE